MSDEIPTGKKLSRSFSKTLQNSLLSSDLYRNRLSADIKEGSVFAAFRNGTIDFYHKGGKLFEYKDRFRTHVKYASVLHGHDRDYIQEADLKRNVRLISDFDEGYHRIKENCANYSGVEASGISEIYSRSGYASSKDDVVVLDIEVSLQTIEAQESDQRSDTRKQDRIDLLLYKRSSRTLCFFEVKHFSNKELWSRASTTPPVVDQLKRYNAQIAARGQEIVSAYKTYIGVARDLFGLTPDDLPDPEALEKEAVLLVFGFDNDQKNRLNKLLIGDGSLDGFSYRCMGNPKTATDLWTNIRTS